MSSTHIADNLEILERAMERSIGELGDKIVGAMKSLARAHGAKSFNDVTLAELQQLAPYDRVLLATTLCEGTSSKVINR